MFDKFTENAVAVMNNATEIAKELSHNYIGTEHLLIGLVKASGVASKVLIENGVEEKKLVKLIEEFISPQSVLQVIDESSFTPRVKKIISQSQRESQRRKSKLVGTEHLLVALLKETDCIAVRLLNTLGVNMQKIFVDLLTLAGEEVANAKNEFAQLKGKAKGKSTTPTLDQYSRDLTEYARESRLDPVIGRESEIKRVIQVLSRRTKNNPCLIGEPGVGKTAIAEGLAQKIVEGNIPDTIKDKRVLTLDLSGMVAGSKYRGEFEDRIKRVISEVVHDGNVLLFIDEIHTIIGAGGAEGAIDASNILKPSLARGEIQLVGATTIEEYRKYIEKDSALERRFQPVMVEEPTVAQTVMILKGLRDSYEAHHQVKITDEALETAANLSERYINDRFLPDKAIDLIDEASSKVRLGAFTDSPQMRKIEEENKKLEIMKEEAIQREDFEQASEMKKKQQKNMDKFNKLKLVQEKENMEKQLVVGESEIADIISQWTKIPVKKLAQEETEKLKNLEKLLHKRVIGQDEAVSAISKAIRRGRVGLKDPERPIGSFLFLGPTGVGKTELSKALAEAMFGTENAIIRVDMSEYMEKHSVSKLIGSPPGYVGYDEGGQFSEKVRRNPYSIILFDEIEKAHPEIFNILLQVLEDGHITDSQGRRVNFKNTVIIMTSNAGAQKIIAPKTLGFASVTDKEQDYKKMKANVLEEVKRLFKPEFLNRIDETIVFHALGKEDVAKIVQIMLNNVNQRIQEQMQITLKPSKTALSFLADTSYDQAYGARPLRRAIQNKVEDQLAQLILDGEIKAGNKVSLGIKNKQLKFTVR